MELTIEQLRDIRDNIPGTVVIYAVLENGIVPLVYSADAPAFSGLTEGEYLDLYGRDTMPVVAEKDIPELVQTIADVLGGAGDKEVTYRTYHKTRGFVWTHVRLRRLGTYEQHPVLLGVFTNFSEEFEVPQLLLDNTEREIYVIGRNDHDLLFANERAIADRGENLKLGQTCYSYIRGKDAPCENCVMRQVTGNEALETQWCDEEHGRIYETRAVPLSFFGRESIALFYNDQTRHIQMEQALSEEHERYRAATEGANLRVYEYDIKAHHIHLPEYSARLFGVPTEVDDVPESVLPLFSDEDQDQVREFFAKVDAGTPTISGEFLMKPVAGYAARLHYTFTTAFDDDGSPMKAYVVAEDVTAIRQEEVRYQRAIGEIIDVNPKTLCAFEFNLTRNTCSASHGTSKFTQDALAADTADGVFSNIETLVTDAGDLERCRTVFNRKYLIAQLDAGCERLSIDYRRMSENGAPIWVTTLISLVRNPSTGDVESVMFSEDIDERKNDEEAVRIVTRNGYDYIALIDPAKSMLSFREMGAMAPERFHDDFHTRRAYQDYDEVRQRSAKLWVHPDEWDAFLANSDLGFVIERLKTCDRYDFSVRGLRGDKMLRKQLQYAYLDSTKRLIVLWQIDVTDTFQKEQEDARRLQDALDEAQRADAAKSDFLSSVSHDMRTPLNGIIGFTELALDEGDPALKQEYLEKIRISGKILKEIVDDTLDLSKIESGKFILKPEVWSSHQLLDEVDVAIRAAADVKGVHFVEDWSNARDGMVLVDRLAEQKIFLNLLSNAVKFTQPGGTVKIAIEDLATRLHGCDVRITVSDTGIGMEPGFLPKVFEPFVQEHAGGSGTGLGLSIAKRLVDLMGGRIEVSSELGKGTTFSVYLPVDWVDAGTGSGTGSGAGSGAGSGDSITAGTGSGADAGAGAAGASGATRSVPDDAGIDVPALLSGRTALLVEDNALNTEIARTMLEHQGMVVICAENGESGVEAFAASEPGDIDVVLMDVRMPRMDGYEATRAIRQLDRPDAASVPVIAMTADAYQDDIRRALDAGMDAHMSKPLDPAIFVRTVAEAVDGSL